MNENADPAPGSLARHRKNLLAIYQEVLRTVNGRVCVAAHLAANPVPPPVHLVAIGKAAAHMAAGAFDALGDGIQSALLITKHEHCEPVYPQDHRVVCQEASHPLPDATSVAAGAKLLKYLERAAPDAAFLFLISGGASSLVEVLPDGVGVADLQRINRWLLGSGLPIEPINRVRKRISKIKAGRLAAYLQGRQTVNLLLSDVPGDDPQAIGSGLLVNHGPEDIDTTALELPDWMQALTMRATPTAERDAFRNIETRILAGPTSAREAAARTGAQYYSVKAHSTLLQGDAVSAGYRIAAIAANSDAGLHIWSGETTVRLPQNPGRGGRCQSLALAAALRIQGRKDLCVLAAGTDGTDGPGEDAGAMVDGGTVERGRLAGLEARSALDAADAGTFLEASEDLILTGPTGTNVMDLVLALSVE